MCTNTDYSRCMECKRYSCDTTIGHRDKPTESIIECVFGGIKKWIWEHTENGIKFVLAKENEHDKGSSN